MLKSEFSLLTAPWTMKLPVPVEFGAGCVAKMAQYASGYKKALIVSQLIATPAEPVIHQIADVLKSAGLASTIFHEFSPESNYDEIEKGAALAKKFGADLIVGFGGGSSMDAAKLIALAASHPEPLLAYRVGGTHAITPAALPILVVTSTSGTGSHIGRVAVVSEREKSLKRFMASDYLYPKAAFCDPEILRLMPPALTAASGFDAFAQALEGYLSNAENPMGNFCAQEAMRIIAGVLPRVYRDGGNLELRAAMAWADTLQGVSLASNAVLTAHVIGMVLGGRCHIPHGQAVAAVTVAALRHSRQGATEKLARIARLMGCREQRSDDQLADWAIDAIENLIQTIHLKKSLTEYGVPAHDYETIAREVRANFAMRLDADPVPKQVADLVWILQESAK